MNRELKKKGGYGKEIAMPKKEKMQKMSKLEHERQWCTVKRSNNCSFLPAFPLAIYSAGLRKSCLKYVDNGMKGTKFERNLMQRFEGRRIEMSAKLTKVQTKFV